MQIFRSKFLSSPCNPLLGHPAPLPALQPESLTSARPWGQWISVKILCCFPQYILSAFNASYTKSDLCLQRAQAQLPKEEIDSNWLDSLPNFLPSTRSPQWAISQTIAIITAFVLAQAAWNWVSNLLADKHRKWKIHARPCWNTGSWFQSAGSAYFLEYKGDRWPGTAWSGRGSHCHSQPSRVDNPISLYLQPPPTHSKAGPNQWGSSLENLGTLNLSFVYRKAPLLSGRTEDSGN